MTTLAPDRPFRFGRIVRLDAQGSVDYDEGLELALGVANLVEYDGMGWEDALIAYRLGMRSSVQVADNGTPGKEATGHSSVFRADLAESLGDPVNWAAYEAVAEEIQAKRPR